MRWQGKKKQRDVKEVMQQFFDLLVAFLYSYFVLLQASQSFNSYSKASLLCSSYMVHSSFYFPRLNQKTVQRLQHVASPAAESWISSCWIQNLVRFCLSLSKFHSIMFHKHFGSMDGLGICRSVHHIIQDWNISTTVGQMAMKFSSDLHYLQRIILLTLLILWPLVSLSSLLFLTKTKTEKSTEKNCCKLKLIHPLI